MRNKFSIALLLLTFCSTVSAQKEKSTKKEAEKISKIALTDILGDWYTSDTIDSKISFIRAGDAEILIEGRREGVSAYRLSVDADSMYVNGSAPNWPPYYCTLLLHDDNLLEIKYFQFSSVEPKSVIYRRESSD